MQEFTVGQMVRAQFPLRPDLHVDLVRKADGWHRIDGTGPRKPYSDRELSLVEWVPIDQASQ